MSPPVGLKAQVLSSTTIVLTWSDNFLGRNQRITDNRLYTVRYNPKMSRRHKYINSTDLNAHIDDLNTRVDHIRLQVERAQSYATLANLGGLPR